MIQSLCCSIVVDIWYAQLDKGPNSANGRECEINEEENLSTFFIFQLHELRLGPVHTADFSHLPDFLAYICHNVFSSHSRVQKSRSRCQLSHVSCEGSVELFLLLVHFYFVYLF